MTSRTSASRSQVQSPRVRTGFDSTFPTTWKTFDSNTSWPTVEWTSSSQGRQDSWMRSRDDLNRPSLITPSSVAPGAQRRSGFQFPPSTVLHQHPSRRTGFGRPCGKPRPFLDGSWTTVTRSNHSRTEDRRRASASTRRPPTPSMTRASRADRVDVGVRANVGCEWLDPTGEGRCMARDRHHYVGG